MKWIDKGVKFDGKKVGDAVWEDTRNVLVHLDTPPQEKPQNDLKWFQKAECEIIP